MYCQKCGTDNGDNVNFCKRCGENLNKEAIASTVSTDKPKKKKSKKMFIILGIIVVIIIGITIATNWGGNIDYVATVQIHRPFANSQGINLTYETVFNKYLESIKWETRKVGDMGYVDISGKIKGNGYELLVTISVIPAEDNGGATITPISATFNGDKITGNDAVEFLLYMFDAADIGYDTLDDYFAESSEYTSDENTPVTSNLINFSQNYRNDEAGVTFKYPDTWEITNVDNSLVGIVKIRPNDTYSVRFAVSESFDIYDFLTSRKEVIEETYAGFAEEFDGIMSVEKLVDVVDTNIGNVSARKLITEGSNVIEETISVSYYYSIGQDIYEINYGCQKSERHIYEPIFEAIMDSYTITSPTFSSKNSIESTSSASTKVPLEEIALNAVKNGTFSEYPDKPIAKTIDKYFNNAEYMYHLEDSDWTSFYDDDGNLIVRNTITYLSSRVMEGIVFEFLYSDDGTFILYLVRSGRSIYDENDYINEIFNDSNSSILGEWYDSNYEYTVDNKYASRIIFNDDGSLVLIANLLHGMLELTGTYEITNESWIRCYVDTEFASDSYGGYFSLYIDDDNTLHYTDENGGSIGEISEHTIFIRK